MVEITPMRLEDLPAVVEIEQRNQMEPWKEAFFIEELNRPDSRLLVARAPRQADSISGYICFWKVLDEIHILNITVDAAWRGQRIGRALLLHALAMGQGDGARVALLEVRRSNRIARNLYESLGFRKVGERPDYYGGYREPAILMELEMDEDWRAKWIGPPSNRELSER